jgi:hypothetical protein
MLRGVRRRCLPNAGAAAWRKGIKTSSHRIVTHLVLAAEEAERARMSTESGCHLIKLPFLDYGTLLHRHDKVHASA